MSPSYPFSRVGTKSFSLVQNAFLQADGLPFRDVLSEEAIDEAFAVENACFAEDEADIYTPPLTLWAWLAQAMHAEKARSCVAAVARITALCVALGREPPSPDTGTYCRARAKLPERVLQRLVYTVGDELESRVPADWLWQGRHVKIADGTTLLAPDTPENQKTWPQARTQKPGIGFPILRMVVLLSLATAALCGLALGPYKGKETGEPALLRELLDRFQAGDVFLGDCCYCSYFLLALLLAGGVDVVVRQHQGRQTDFRRGQRLGDADHVVVWQRPQRPEWMDEETYATIPETLTVRELRVRVDVRGFRVRELVVVTTLTDATHYPAAEIARLFRLRWHVELDLRNIKTSLRLDDLRGKTPDMVRREIWVHWLAYNLIRKVMAQAALSCEKLPRELSFAGALSAVLGAWAHASVAAPSRLLALAQVQHRMVTHSCVGHRPNRIEPRAIKRRPKAHKLLCKPRAEARAELLRSGGTRR
ncbi:MAG: IS4 family transposase [bacterium]